MGNILSWIASWTHRMDSPEEHILRTLKELDAEEFKNFKLHLRQSANLEGLEPIPKGLLGKNNKGAIAGLIVQSYPSNAAQKIMVNVLNKIHRNDLLERFPDMYKVVTLDQHEDSDTDTLPSSSISASRRVSEVKDQHEDTDTLPSSSTSTSRQQVQPQLVSNAEAQPKVAAASVSAPVKHVVDQYRRFLIEKVTMINPILDLLLDEGVITQEGYAIVLLSKATNQDKMRELYTFLTSRKAKDIFYKGLEEYEKCLLNELGCSKPLLSATQHEGAAVSVPGLLVSTSGHLITYYEDTLQGKMYNTYLCVILGTEPEVMFKDIYITLYNVDTNVANIHRHHEVRQMEMNKAGEEKEIQLDEIFKDTIGRNKRTVLTVGCAGIGKTFLVHKFVFDWVRKCFSQDPHLMFPLKFRQLNLLKGESLSLAKLIHKCIKETRFIEEDDLNSIFNVLQKSGDYNTSPFKVLFVLDGLDEINFCLNFRTNYDFSDLTKSFPMEALIVNLIKGELLPSAQIWITSRPAAASQIPKRFVNRMTEVRGFIRDEQKKEYFMKTLGDEKQASSIYSHIKESKIIYTMCEIPVFCWITTTVVQSMGMTAELPKTLTEMYCHFVMAETQREKMKNPAVDEADKEKFIEDQGEVLLKLGRLAFDQLDKGNIMFYQKDLEESGLDVNNDLLCSGLCTAFFKKDDVFFLKTVYCFVHLSIQEFLAAVYLYHCFTQRNLEVQKSFLKGSSYRSLSDFLKAAMAKTLKIESGHLDLFVRFLHGLSLESNQRLLGGLLGQTENCSFEIQRAINNLKMMNDYMFSPDRCINIFHCLMEMKDHSISQGIQQYLESENRSGKELSVTQCSALATMLQMSEVVLRELDLQMYNTSREGRLRLIPAVRNCRTARLVDCGLSKTQCEVLASALSSDPSYLRELDLSDNTLQDPGLLELLCTGLRSLHCRLGILRLTNCWLSERCCEVLASALSSNPSHLRELDLSLNMVNESGLKMLLSAGLENFNVTHGGENWLESQLIKSYFHCLTLDANTANRNLSLSKHNRKVTAADHNRKVTAWRQVSHPQVLCTRGLTGRCYWEVDWSGTVSIAVTYKGISDCSLGFNDKSWNLECGNSYIVRHNSKSTVLPVHPSGEIAARDDSAVLMDSDDSDDNDVSVSDDRVAEGISDCRLGFNDKSWNLVHPPTLMDSDDSDDNDVSVNDDRVEVYCGVVGVYVDCSAGTLSFYTVSSETLTHLYTFQNTFTEPLYPGFWLYPGSSVCLRQAPRVAEKH